MLAGAFVVEMAGVVFKLHISITSKALPIWCRIVPVCLARGFGKRVLRHTVEAESVSDHPVDASFSFLPVHVAARFPFTLGMVSEGSGGHECPYFVGINSCIRGLILLFLL